MIEKGVVGGMSGDEGKSLGAMAYRINVSLFIDKV